MDTQAFYDHAVTVTFPSRHSATLEGLPAFVKKLEKHITEESRFFEKTIAGKQKGIDVSDLLTDIPAFIDSLGLVLVFACKYPEFGKRLKDVLLEPTTFNLAASAAYPWLKESDRQAYIRTELQGQAPPAMSADLQSFARFTGLLEDALLSVLSVLGDDEQ